MWRKVIRLYKLPFAILLFLLGFSFFHMAKPNFAYDTNGAFRQFGVGYKQKTILSGWVVAILLSVFCYLCVLHLLSLGQN